MLSLKLTLSLGTSFCSNFGFWTSPNADFVTIFKGYWSQRRRSVDRFQNTFHDDVDDLLDCVSTRECLVLAD